MSNRLHSLKKGAMRAGLTALYHSGAPSLLGSFAQGMGLIFMLHQVRPEARQGFAPNRILEVTPEFLEAVIRQVREADLDIVSLDEAHDRIVAGATDRRFACFTLDDGYRDNVEHAYPVFKTYGVPFTVYVPSDYPEGRGELWWLALEEVIERADVLRVDIDGERETLPTASEEEKWGAYDRIYWWLRQIGEDRQRVFMKDLCSNNNVSLETLGDRLLMTWDEVSDLAKDPLVTIGAHTVGHYALAKLDADRARIEMARGADLLAEKLGFWPRHLSYPYGDEQSAGPREFQMAEELGFKTAVTTRKGLVFPEHADHLMALPRVSLNGDFQSLKYTALYLTGAPFALWNGFRKLNVA